MATSTTVFIFFLLLLTRMAAVAAFDVPTTPFSEGFSHLFGNDNLIRSKDDQSVRLSLNRYSGNPSTRSTVFILSLTSRARN